jgi:hypothetical protein
LDLYLRPGLPSSFIRDGLVVVNNSKHLSHLPIPIRADIVGKIRHLPDYVEFGAIPYQGVAEQTLRLDGQQKFAITSKRAELLVNGQAVSPFDSYLDIADKSEVHAETRQLALRLKNTDQLTGSVHGRLILETSDPGQREIVVNFYAFFQE